MSFSKTFSSCRWRPLSILLTGTSQSVINVFRKRTLNCDCEIANPWDKKQQSKTQGTSGSLNKINNSVVLTLKASLGGSSIN